MKLLNLPRLGCFFVVMLFSDVMTIHFFFLVSSLLCFSSLTHVFRSLKFPVSNIFSFLKGPKYWKLVGNWAEHQSFWYHERTGGVCITSLCHNKYFHARSCCSPPRTNKVSVIMGLAILYIFDKEFFILCSHQDSGMVV